MYSITEAERRRYKSAECPSSARERQRPIIWSYIDESLGHKHRHQFISFTDYRIINIMRVWPCARRCEPIHWWKTFFRYIKKYLLEDYDVHCSLLYSGDKGIKMLNYHHRQPQENS